MSKSSALLVSAVNRAIGMGLSFSQSMMTTGMRAGHRRFLQSFWQRMTARHSRRYCPSYVFDLLESRVMLSGTLLNITDHTDMVLDATRNQIDIISSNGVIHRYNATTGKLIADIVVSGASLWQGDITPDGRFLFVSDAATTVIHKVDLATGGVTDLAYTATDSGERMASDLVVMSDSLALFMSYESGSGNHYPLHTINIETGEIGSTSVRALTGFHASSKLERSADGSTLLINELGASDDPFSIYDVTTEKITGTGNVSFGWWRYPIIAVSRDGNLIATSDTNRGTTAVWDKQANMLVGSLSGGSVYFSPTQDTLYVLQSGSQKLLAYDTTNFQLVATFDVGESFNYSSGSSNDSGTGMMAASADGKQLLIATNSGVRVVNVDPAAIAKTTLTASDNYCTPAKKITLTATLSGRAIYNGSVVFKDGEQTLATVAVRGNVATYSFSSTVAGVHDLSATFVDSVTGVGSPSSTLPVVAFGSTALSDLIPITNRNDIIVDSHRNQLDIIISNGDILRYDLKTYKFVSSIHVDGTIGRGDISKDGKYLYVTDAAARVIHQIDLDTGAATSLGYKITDSGEAYPADLVVVSDTLALFTNYQYGSGGAYYLHAIDLQTGTIANYTSTSPLRFSSGTTLTVSADGSTLVAFELSSSNGPFTVYDLNTKTVVGRGNVSFGWWRYPILSVSRDGGLIATSDTNRGTTTVWNRLGQVIKSDLAGGSVYFSPLNDTLYIQVSGSDSVQAYDSTTFTLKATYHTGAGFNYSAGTDNNAGTGIMSITSDGNTLFVGTNAGIKIVNVTDGPVPVPGVTSTKSNITLGEQVTLTASLPPNSGFWFGTVTFKSGDVVLGTAALDENGNASLTSSRIPGGANSVVAIFKTNTGVSSAGSTPVAVNVSQATPTIRALVVNSGSLMTPPTLGVQMTGITGFAVTGTVEIYNETALIASGTLVSGAVQITPGEPLPEGDYNLTARYVGDANYSGVTSTSMLISIHPLATNTTITANHTELAPDEPLLLSIAVGASSGSVTTGNVSIYNGSDLLGTVDLDEDGTAVYSVGLLPLGTHSFKAIYNGSTAFTGSNTIFNIKVAMPKAVAATVTLDADQERVGAGSSVTLSAGVTSSLSSAATGSVSFYDGKTLLTTVQLDDDGYASFTIDSLAAGTHQFTAVYSGSMRIAKATSSKVQVESYEVTYVDLLVVYTANAAYSSILNTIQAAVDQTNEALMNSQVDVMIRLVGTEEVDYNESGDFSTDIKRLSTAGDGYLDDVSMLRRKYHADLVSLFVGWSEDDLDGDGYYTVGIGSVLNSSSGNANAAYSVISAPDADQYVLAHELGHNFGARHEYANDKSGQGFTNGHGYEFHDEYGNNYHDIMAYGSEGSELIPYYSNPDIVYYEHRIGTSHANAAAVIRQNAGVVSRYSDSLPGISEATAPEGAIVSVTNTTIRGWAFDANLGNQAALIRIDIDGVAGTPFYANLNDPSLELLFGSTKHGFEFKIPTTISVGNHTVTLFVKDAGGTDFVEAASQTVYIDTRANLDVSVAAPANLLSTYVPGDTLTLPVTITNTGASTAVGTKDAPITLTIRMSLNDSADDGAVTVVTLTLPYSIAAGTSKKINVAVPITTLLASGGYHLFATIDSSGKVDEVDETNNVAAFSQVVNVAWQFGAIAGRTGNTVMTFNDGDGTKVTLNLAGPGTGTLSTDASGYNIVLKNTTVKSRLTVGTAKTKVVGDDARFVLNDLIVGNPDDENDHTGIEWIIAKTTDLTGDVTVSGVLLNLNLHDARNASTISVGNSLTTTVPTLNITVGRAQDLVVHSDIAINKLTATEWLSSSPNSSSINSMSLATLNVTGDKKMGIAGDFSGDIHLAGAAASNKNTLGAVSVASHILAGNWQITGLTGSISAQAIDLGWQGSFLGASGNIGTLKLTGKSATSSLAIDANSIGTLSIAGNLNASLLTLSQGVSNSVAAIKNFSVSGDLSSVTVRAMGNIGTLYARSMASSNIYLGVKAGVSGLPLDASDFAATVPANAPVLGKLRLTGFARGSEQPVFVASNIAAGTIKSVDLSKALVQFVSSGPAQFGFATLVSGGKYSGPGSAGSFVSLPDSAVV